MSLVNMSDIDIVLISNYHCMMALPFITEYTNFKGIIYATEPTLHIGRSVNTMYSILSDNCFILLDLFYN